jgi:hypothetical protein
MRRVIAVALAVILALALAPSAPEARAAQGIDSGFAGESAFLTLRPGEQGSFIVLFRNTGTTAWVLGTSTEVTLVACRDDKVTCAVEPEEAAWAVRWVSTIAYARQLQTIVAPGQVATFAYEIRAPLTATAGVYRFNGDLAVASTLGAIHPEGYYQDVVLLAGPPTPTSAPAPATPEREVAPAAPAPTASPSPPPPPPPLPPPAPPPPAPAGP